VSAAHPAEGALPLVRQLEHFFRRRGHGDDAPDLVQDLFVVLLSRKTDLLDRGPGAFRSFVFAIAYRLGANATRRRRFAALTGTIDSDRVFVSSAADPELEVLLAENALRAASALDALPDGTRRALLLVADEGRSIREAAVVLGTSEDVVRARLCRGRKRIAGILKGE